MLEEKADYSVSMMARVLGVSRSGFYRWPKAGGSGEDPGGPLKEAIIEIWDASGRRFGLRKVWSKLTGDPKYGRFAGTTPYRVRKCMSELGIRGICPNASRRTTVPDRDAPARPGLMGRGFPGPVPATKLVGGITYLGTTGGFICLAVVIDLCARMVVGWSMRDNMRAGLVVAALEMARSRGHVAGGAMFHSDRGSQHASAELAAWAAAHDVRLSVGRTGSRHDNAVAESFFGTLKSEWYHHERPSDASTAKHGAIEFIESYYNRFRPHESIGDRVPAEAMQEFFDRFESALQADPEAMLAAWKSATPLSIILTGL
ncbi:IS3 family transposase, partial [Olsenella sp. AM30-3LB]